MELSVLAVFFQDSFLPVPDPTCFPCRNCHYYSPPRSTLLIVFYILPGNVRRIPKIRSGIWKPTQTLEPGTAKKGIDYKWIVLSITTIEMFMVSVNGSITLISLPAIFNGINIDPLTSFQYLIWVLMGYSLVTATLLLSCGRLSDMYGRVKLYNIGFAIFTARVHPAFPHAGQRQRRCP